MGEEVKLVLGLDFGTTFTGVAFCDNAEGVDNPSLVFLVTSWPGVSTGGNSEKVPSRICYGLPPNGEIKWGNQIKATTPGKVHALMKLRLDEGLSKSQRFKILMAILSDNLENLDLNDLGDDSDDEDAKAWPNKTPVEIVGDYLSAVRENVWEQLRQKYGDVLLSTIRKELVVTVPAVWSERAKDLTLKAVSQAKWDVAKISLVTEPEAAAIYTLKYMSQGAHKSSINVGDSFVLCDAGGGTVDLISYTITQTEPMFRIEEAAIGTGDKCGATFVDKEFLGWLKEWIGEEAYKKIPETRLRHGSALMNQFEICKKEFSGDDEDMQVPLPKECGIRDDASKNIEDLQLTISTEQMKSFFKPSIKRTIELIDGQVKSMQDRGKCSPKMILLVGGFGCNAYLRACIDAFGRERGITTTGPAHSWSAVARGAVCRGLEGEDSGLVEVRLARKHYGTATSRPFNPKLHDQEDRYIDEYTNTPYAKGQMNWLVDQGEQLPEGTPKKASIECCANFRENEPRMFGAVLVGCDESKAPSRYADSSTYNICKAVADLSTVPLHKFQKARTGLNGEVYYTAEFKLEATFASGMIEWSFIYDGKSYGSVNVSYDQS